MRTHARRFFAAVVVGTAAFLSVVATASAYQVTRSAGRPGVVNAKAILGYAYTLQAPSVSWPGGKIYRSPAAPNRLQIICARYVLYDWNYTWGAWQTFATAPAGRQTCVSVARGAHVNMASITHAGGWDSGRYRGVWGIRWYANRPTYRMIASETLDFEDQGDYVCETGGCQILYMLDQDRYVLFFPG
jgi:hypothetical protein